MGIKVIEFVGNPGAGKSTMCSFISKEIKNSLQMEDIGEILLSRKNKVFFKLKYILFFILKDRDVSRKIMKIIPKDKNTIKNKVKIYFNLFFIVGTIKWYEEKKCEYILYDQGLIQAIWSILIDSPKNDNLLYNLIEILNKYINVIDNIYYIETEKEILMKRLELRQNGGSRLEKKDEESKKILLEKSKDLYEAIFMNLEKIRIKRINNNSLQDLEREKSKIILEIIEG